MLYIYEKAGTLFQILPIESQKMSHRKARVFFFLIEKQSSHIFFNQSFNLVSQHWHKYKTYFREFKDVFVFCSSGTWLLFEQGTDVRRTRKKSRHLYF